MPSDRSAQVRRPVRDAGRFIDAGNTGLLSEDWAIFLLAAYVLLSSASIATLTLLQWRWPWATQLTREGSPLEVWQRDAATLNKLHGAEAQPAKLSWSVTNAPMSGSRL